MGAWLRRGAEAPHHDVGHRSDQDDLGSIIECVYPTNLRAPRPTTWNMQGRGFFKIANKRQGNHALWRGSGIEFCSFCKMYLVEQMDDHSRLAKVKKLGSVYVVPPTITITMC